MSLPTSTSNPRLNNLDSDSDEDQPSEAPQNEQDPVPEDADESSESGDSEAALQEKLKLPSGRYLLRPAVPLQDRWNEKLEEAHEVVYAWAEAHELSRPKVAELITYADENVRTAAFMQREHVYTHLGMMAHAGEAIYKDMPEDVRRAVYKIFPEQQNWAAFLLFVFVPLCCVCCCGLFGAGMMIFYFYLVGYKECGEETVLDAFSLSAGLGCAEAILQHLPMIGTPSPPPPL